MPHSAPEQSSPPANHDTPIEGGLVPPKRSSWCSPLSDGLLTFFFLLFLAGPPVGYFFGWKGSVDLHENRNLAAEPNFASDPIAQWPSKVEAYYNDRFGFRTDLVHLYNLLVHRYLRASSVDLVIGNDGWVFYARENMFKDFFGKSLFSENELQNWKRYLEDRQAQLARRNAHYLFVIAPDKDKVYFEKLPSYVREHKGLSRLNQLKEYLRRTGSPVEILDLHEALVQAKKQGTLYFPQDTHWNGRGFFVGYQAICAALVRWFPGVHPQKLGTDYTVIAKAWIGGDWSMVGLPEENLTYQSEFLVPLGTQRTQKGVPPFPLAVRPIPESWNAPLFWEGPGENSLLIFHDSYMRTGPLDGDQVPLAEHFARTLLVGMKPSQQEFQLIMDKFHPDVVIEERAERFMAAVPSQ